MLELGTIVGSGWTLVEEIRFEDAQVGGFYSSCFHVRKDGKTAFLKALNLERFSFADLIPALLGFEHEKKLVTFCTDRGLSRIVQVIESGALERPTEVPALRTIPFLIFEHAPLGDIRESVDVSKSVTHKWRFSLLHQTTVALLQLHSHLIAHQDLKPSNVLRFSEGGIKLGDLGCSSKRGDTAPHDDKNRPGTATYASFEQRYNYRSEDWIERRLATDVFHLGCLTVFAFTNVCFPEFVMSKLAEVYRPQNWGNPYFEVIDHVQAATIEAVSEISQDFPLEFRPDLTQIVLDLCNPNPTLRGRTGVMKKNVPSSLWLQRYASRFDVLEKRAHLRRPVPNA